MSTHRKTAAVVGVLYIIGTVAGVLSVVFTGSILDGPDYLVNVAANANQVILGALISISRLCSSSLGDSYLGSEIGNSQKGEE